MKNNALYNYFKRNNSTRTWLAIMLVINGLLIIIPMLMLYDAEVLRAHKTIHDVLQSFGIMKLLDIPRFTLGVLLMILAFPVFQGMRIGWIFSSFILFVLVLLNLVLARENAVAGTFSLILFGFSLVHWKLFHKHSLPTASFVAFISLTALIGFSVFGTLYMGDEFHPHVTDIPSAFYFALVCMTTVGFGDIVPISVDARLFTVSIVILGISIFTTSIVYVLGVILKDTRTIVRRRLFKMKDHYVIVGASPLSLHTFHGLRKRDLNIMVLCTEEEKKLYPDDAAVVVTTKINKESLSQVNLNFAKGLFVLGKSDAENTLTVLAAKELVGKNIKTVVLVNEDQNHENMRILHVDLLISLTSIGSEVLLKLLFGENIDNQVIENIIFANNVLD